MKWLIIEKDESYHETNTIIHELPYSDDVTKFVNSRLNDACSFSVYLVQCEYEVVPKEIVKSVELKVKKNDCS